MALFDQRHGDGLNETSWPTHVAGRPGGRWAGDRLQHAAVYPPRQTLPSGCWDRVGDPSREFFVLTSIAGGGLDAVKSGEECAEIADMVEVEQPSDVAES